MEDRWNEIVELAESHEVALHAEDDVRGFARVNTERDRIAWDRAVPSGDRVHGVAADLAWVVAQRHIAVGSDSDRELWDHLVEMVEERGLEIMWGIDQPGISHGAFFPAVGVIMIEADQPLLILCLVLAHELGHWIHDPHGTDQGPHIELEAERHATSVLEGIARRREASGGDSVDETRKAPQMAS